MQGEYSDAKTEAVVALRQPEVTKPDTLWTFKHDLSDDPKRVDEACIWAIKGEACFYLGEDEEVKKCIDKITELERWFTISSAAKQVRDRLKSILEYKSS